MPELKSISRGAEAPARRPATGRGKADRSCMNCWSNRPSAVLQRETRMIVLPDPSLASLNFETLIVPGSNAHFWIEDVTLTTASSLTLLAQSPKPDADNHPYKKNLLLVGNTEAGETYPALAKAHEEMERIERYFPETERSVLEGKQATPRAFLHSEPGKFTYLHFVTHGTASVTRPLDSAVILSRDGDSYKLYARDIIHQPLNGRARDHLRV